MEMRFRGRRQDNGEVVSHEAISSYHPDAQYGLLMGSAWLNEEEGVFSIDLELFTGFEDSNGNGLYENDIITIEHEPHSIVWSVEKGMWVAETDDSDVSLAEVASQSTFASC
jgi:hypothetical protein